MNKPLFYTALLAAALAAPAAAAASCTRANLTGTWHIYTMYDNVARCTLVIPATGNALASTSRCTVPGVISSTPLSGALTIAADCHVTGSVTAAGYRRVIDAYLNSTKNSISGMGYDQSYPDLGHIFTGEK